jgi:hypothetical protein
LRAFRRRAAGGGFIIVVIYRGPDGRTYQIRRRGC